MQNLQTEMRKLISLFLCMTLLGFVTGGGLPTYRVRRRNGEVKKRGITGGD